MHRCVYVGTVQVHIILAGLLQHQLTSFAFHQCPDGIRNPALRVSILHESRSCVIWVTSGQ